MKSPRITLFSIFQLTLDGRTAKKKLRQTLIFTLNFYVYGCTDRPFTLVDVVPYLCSSLPRLDWDSKLFRNMFCSWSTWGCIRSEGFYEEYYFFVLELTYAADSRLSFAVSDLIPIFFNKFFTEPWFSIVGFYPSEDWGLDSIKLSDLRSNIPAVLSTFTTCMSSYIYSSLWSSS